MTQRTYLLRLSLLWLCFSSLWAALQAQQARQFPFNGVDLAYVAPIDKVALVGRQDDQPFDETALFLCDPITGDIELFYNPESRITGVQVSADQSLLYLSTSNPDSAIIAFNLPDLSINYAFSVNDPVTNGEYIITAWQVSPRDPELLAIVRYSFTASPERQLVLYDRGQPRANTLDRTLVTFAFDEVYDRIYEKVNSGTDHSFRQLDFDQNGIYPSDTAYQFFHDKSELPLFEQRIVGHDGTVIDVSGPRPRFLAHHSHRTQDNNRIYFESRAVFHDPDRDEIYHIFTKSGTTEQMAINVYDDQRYELLRVLTFPAPYTFYRPIRAFGPGLFFGYFTDNRFVLVQECEQVPATPDPSQLLDLDQLYCSTQNFTRVDVGLSTSQGLVYTVDGRPIDSLYLVGNQTVNQVRVADDQGCLSEPSAPFQLKVAHQMPPPTILGLGDPGVYLAGTPQRCRDGKAFLTATFEWPEDEQRIVWSTGDTSTYLATDVTEPITARVLSKEGCLSEPSESVSIEVIDSPIPDPPLFVGTDGNINECTGSSEKDLEAEAGFVSYRWLIEDRFRLGNTVTLRREDRSEGVYLQASNNAGCWTDPHYEHVRFVTSISRPDQPEILQVDNVLSSDVQARHYEWYRNGELLPNSDRAVWTAEESGEYQVRVFQTYCWSTLSDVLLIP